MKKLISILIVSAVIGALSIGCSAPEEQGATGGTGGTPPSGATGEQKPGQTAPDVKAEGTEAPKTEGGSTEAPKTETPGTEAPKTEGGATEKK